MRSPSWSRGSWRWVGGAGIIALVLARTGGGPVVAGLRALDVEVLALGAGIALLTTVACAWRWHLVARELGVGIRPSTAVVACYRAQFLNTVLPGGVLGDVHRGVVHGRSAGATGPALRAVAWERFAGQVVQAVVATALLLALPSPVGPRLPWVVGVVVAVTAVVALVAWRAPAAGGEWWRRLLRTAHEDVRLGLLVRRSWPGVVVASTVAMAGHVATYVVAARAVGVTAPLPTVLPLAVLVLVVGGLPLNLAGWGPREGMAAWVFAAAGLGSGTGVAAAVAYGAIVLVANLPGAVSLLVGSDRHPSPRAAARAPAGAGSRLCVGGRVDA